jgi:hypothetical protein
VSVQDRALAIGASSWLAASVAATLAATAGSDELALAAAAPALVLCARLAGRPAAVVAAALVPVTLLVAGLSTGDGHRAPIDVVVATALLMLTAGVAAPTPDVADVARRAATVRSLKRLRRAIHDCAGAASPEQATAVVAGALTETLGLRACWFEPDSERNDIVELTADGDTTALVQHRLPEGLALPPLVALPVFVGSRQRGRFLLEADPSVGHSPEERMIAVALGELAALRVDTAPGPRGTRPTPYRPR